jgi:hypothetical protein
VLSTPNLPALVATSWDRASLRFLEFFASNIRNRNTRLAYDAKCSRRLAGYATTPPVGTFGGLWDL